MIRILTNTEINEEVAQGLADGWGLGPGLTINLDAEATESFLVEPGSTVRIHRPDGTFIDRIAKGVSPPGSPVAIFLPNTKRHEVPAGSEVELPPFCIPLFPVETP